MVPYYGTVVPTLPRIGYTQETRIMDAILSLLPKDFTPIRWTDLWVEAHRRDVGSKRTFQKYFRQLTDSGRIIKEGRMYRRNPTYGDARAERLRERAKGRDVWSTRIHVTFHGLNAESTVDKCLRELIGFSISTTLAYYVEALQMIAKAPSEKAAHDIMNLFLQAETFQLVMTARQVYDFRRKADFAALKKDPKFRFLKLGESPAFGVEGLFGGDQQNKVSRS
jgi:hypothetical protein